MKSFIRLWTLTFFLTVACVAFADEQQIHIKARFVEVPETQSGVMSFGEIVTNGAASLRAVSWQSIGNITNAGAVTNAPSGWMCILTRAKLVEVIRTFQSRKDFEALAEPEVTTVSGRQTQMRATQIININSSRDRSYISGPASDDSKIERVEIGPVLDVIPNIMSDGFTINLAAIPSFTKLIGSVQSTNTPPLLLPKIRGWQVAANVNLWDGQTVVIGGLPPVSGKPDEMELLLFITATIVDSAGNKVHSDNEMSFAQKGIPPQPK